jgi:hypothetical protein
VTAGALTRLHDNVADFIDRTDNLPPRAGRSKPGETGCASER